MNSRVAYDLVGSILSNSRSRPFADGRDRLLYGRLRETHSPMDTRYDCDWATASMAKLTIKRGLLAIAMVALAALFLDRVARAILRPKMAFGDMRAVQVRPGAFPGCIMEAASRLPGIVPRFSNGRVSMVLRPDSNLTRFDVSADELNATSVEVFALLPGEEPTAEQLAQAKSMVTQLADAVSSRCADPRL